MLKHFYLKKSTASRPAARRRARGAEEVVAAMADGVRSSPDPATARGASPAPGGGTRSSDRGHGRRRGAPTGVRRVRAQLGAREGRQRRRTGGRRWE
jgi:hypothetical protein